MRNTVVAVGLVALVGALASPAAAQRAEGSFERTLTISGRPTLDVGTGSGGIRIRSGAPGSVRVVARVQVYDRKMSQTTADAKVKDIIANPPVVQSGNVVRIGRVGAQDQDRYRSVSISYDLTVPAECDVQSEAGSGNIDIADVGGTIGAHAGSGSITIARANGPLSASAGSGGLDLDTVSGSVDASTGSGSIHVRGLAGTLKASAGSGSIDVDGDPRGDWDVRTGSGGVSLRLPSSIGFELDASAGSGSVSSSHPVTMIGKVNRSSLRGTVRGGGPTLRIRTGSGSIRVM